MGTSILDYLRLFFTEGLSLKDKFLALERAGSIYQLFHGDLPTNKAEKSQLLKLRKLVNRPLYQNRAEQEYALCNQNQIQICTYENSNYPDHLKHCSDAPILFFYRGNISILKTPSISIVGTRRSDIYGKRVTESICNGLKEFKPNIVSGFARGIDTYAHESALAEGCKTTAVIATGFSKTYPSENLQLMSKIVSHGGLIMSEQAFYAKVLPYHFIQRNRIIAALGDACIVVQSRAKGGSLSTAKLAFSYNKLVFAVPGRIGDSSSLGCLQMLSDKIAEPYLDENSLIDQLFWEIDKEDATSKAIPEALAHFPLQKAIHFEELLDKSGKELSELQQDLLNLEMDKKIISLGYGFYQLS